MHGGGVRGGRVLALRRGGRLVLWGPGLCAPAGLCDPLVGAWEGRDGGRRVGFACCVSLFVSACSIVHA